MTMFSGSW